MIERMDARAYIAIIVGCAAAVDDLRRRAISNWICLAGIAGGLIYHLVQHGLMGLLTAAGGALLGFAAFLVFYCLGGMGGGDLKLMAGFGALLGPSGIWVAALLACMIGAVIAAACLLFKSGTRAIPYAPAIVLGAWLSLLAGR